MNKCINKSALIRFPHPTDALLLDANCTRPFSPSHRPANVPDASPLAGVLPEVSGGLIFSHQSAASSHPESRPVRCTDGGGLEPVNRGPRKAQHISAIRKMILLHLCVLNVPALVYNVLLLLSTKQRKTGDYVMFVWMFESLVSSPAHRRVVFWVLLALFFGTCTLCKVNVYFLNGAAGKHVFP